VPKLYDDSEIGCPQCQVLHRLISWHQCKFYVELDTGWRQYQVLRRLKYMLAQVPTFTLTQILVGSCAKLGGTGRHQCQVLHRPIYAGTSANVYTNSEVLNFTSSDISVGTRFKFRHQARYRFVLIIKISALIST